MTSRWFRVYETMVDDPKVQRLSADLFRVLVNLWCIASKNGGTLPSLGDIAYTLRIREDRVQKMLDELASCELLDTTDDGLAPHNWNTRQYKSDVTDATAADRQKKYRNKKRNATVTPERNATVTHTTRAETEQNRTEDDDEEARPPLISDASNKLADEIASIVGHDLAFVPPAWFGSAYQTQKWLDAGWPREIILASVREQMQRRNGDKPDRITYFEKGIVAAIARQNKPLPTVKIIEGETVNVRRNAETGNVIAATDRLLDRLRSFDEPIPDNARTGSGEGATVVRMLPERGR
ncbi:MAG: hypothetical protein F2743_08475 [Actinobacteria bacterium]|nr:hypothetical protein [Actinomycetota bacterium]